MMLPSIVLYLVGRPFEIASLSSVRDVFSLPLPLLLFMCVQDISLDLGRQLARKSWVCESMSMNHICKAWCGAPRMRKLISSFL